MYLPIYLIPFFIILDSLVSAFTTSPISLTSHRQQKSQLSANRVLLFSLGSSRGDDDMVESSQDSPSLDLKKRRRRKDDNTSVPTSSALSASSPTIDTVQQPTTLQAKAMSLQVTDIRQLVSGKPDASSWTTSTMNTVEGSDKRNTITSKELSNMQPYNDLSSDSNKSKSNDSLERLLADAKKMRQERKNEVSKPSDDGPNEVIVNALSTLVTVDFFIVCGFLVWFLLGVFFSYALHNDAVQIAFNGVFQALVQPALGILMIGSALSGKFLFLFYAEKRNQLAFVISRCIFVTKHSGLEKAYS